MSTHGPDGSAQARLGKYVAAWWQAIDDFTALLEELDPDEWRAPTDLPGWDVHACAAHTAHLEALLAGGRHEDVEVGDAPHVRSAMGRFTEQGVLARRDRTPDELINEIRESATTRHTELLESPPADPDAPAGGLFGALGWSTETLLRNRPLDVWMHEQDVRRATRRPGNMDTAAARHTADYLAESLGYVLAKRVGAAPGTTVRLDVDGSDPVAFEVAEDGRGRRLPGPPADATVRLAADRETFVLLAGGRRPVADGVRVEGDADLGRAVLDNLAVTP